MNRKKRIVLIVILVLCVICCVAAFLIFRDKPSEPIKKDDPEENTGINDPETKDPEIQDPEIQEPDNPDEKQPDDITIITELLSEEGITAKSISQNGKTINLEFDTEGESKCTLNDKLLFTRIYEIVYYKVVFNDTDHVNVDMVNSDGKILTSFRSFDLKKNGIKDPNFDAEKVEKEINDLLQSEFDYDFESIKIQTEYSNSAYIIVNCSTTSAPKINENLRSFFISYRQTNPSLNEFIIELHNENGDIISYLMVSLEIGDYIGWMSPEVSEGYGPMSPEDY